MIRDINSNLLEVINNQVKMTYPILFQRNSREEMQGIIFYDQNNTQSPRIHFNNFYQKNIIKRTDQIFNWDYIAKSRSIPVADIEPARQYKAKKEFHRAVTKPFDEVWISEEIQLIMHWDDKEKFRINCRNNAQTENMNNSQKQNIQASSIQKIQRNRRSTIANLNLISQIKLIKTKNKEASSSENENELSVFWFDFVLSSVFGYKWVNVRSEEGTFEVFEPSLKKNAINRMQTYLFKKKSGSDSDSDSDSSVFLTESSEDTSSIKGFQNNKAKLKKVENKLISRTVTTSNNNITMDQGSGSLFNQPNQLKHTLTSNKTFKR